MSKDITTSISAAPDPSANAATQHEEDGANEPTVEELLAVVLTGGSKTLDVASGIDAAVGELEALYEALDAHKERWASSAVHLVQCRLRVLADVARMQARRVASPTA